MRFNTTKIQGAALIDLEKRGDDRGFFARFFCVKEFEDNRLETTVAQANNSYSAEKGTLRGMHYQLPPFEEDKLVRCIQGSVWDVVLDLRRDSPTFGQHFGAELTAGNRSMMFVPRGCAHGFLTLAPNTEVLYLVSNVYAPQHERGIRWNDPAFNVRWPIEPTVVSEKDQTHPNFE